MHFKYYNMIYILAGNRVFVFINEHCFLILKSFLEFIYDVIVFIKNFLVCYNGRIFKY